MDEANRSATRRGVTDVKIRSATETDVEALSSLKLSTFRETFLEGFGIPYPSADLALFEHEKYDPSRVAAELADQTHQTWVIESGDGSLDAYAHAGPCGLQHPEVRGGDVELYQLYIRRDAQGAGLGKTLLEIALAWLRTFDAAIWLGVWSGNHRAAALYRSKGFVKVGEYQFPVGEWRDEEHIYRLPRPSAAQ